MPPLARMPALGRATLLRPRAAKSTAERPPAGIAPTRLCCMDCRRLAVCWWNETGRATLLCVPKNRCEPPPRIVEGAAARPLAERLAREGTTGRLPAIMRAPLICCALAATGRTLPAPKCPAFTVDIARYTWLSRILLMFENRFPPCSGAIPPQRLTLILVILTFVTFTTPKRPRYPPHQGWYQSQGPSGSQPKPPHPPYPKPKPQPPPHPQKDT